LSRQWLKVHVPWVTGRVVVSHYGVAVFNSRESGPPSSCSKGQTIALAGRMAVFDLEWAG